MIKFIAAAIWICVATIGAVVYSFQSAGAKTDAAPPAPMLGGLDYIKTDIISVPVLREGLVQGYFLARFVYTADPKQLAKLSVPADALLMDEVYTYIFGNPKLDFVNHETLDLDAFRNGVRESINKRIGEELVKEVLVEQMDYLSKDEIRDNAIRRRMNAGATARAMAKPFNEGPSAAPAEAEPKAEGHSSGH